MVRTVEVTTAESARQTNILILDPELRRQVTEFEVGFLVRHTDELFRVTTLYEMPDFVSLLGSPHKSAVQQFAQMVTRSNLVQFEKVILKDRKGKRGTYFFTREQLRAFAAFYFVCQTLSQESWGNLPLLVERARKYLGKDRATRYLILDRSGRNLNGTRFLLNEGRTLAAWVLDQNQGFEKLIALPEVPKFLGDQERRVLQRMPKFTPQGIVQAEGWKSPELLAGAGRLLGGADMLSERDKVPYPVAKMAIFCHVALRKNLLYFNPHTEDIPKFKVRMALQRIGEILGQIESGRYSLEQLFWKIAQEVVKNPGEYGGGNNYAGTT